MCMMALYVNIPFEKEKRTTPFLLPLTAPDALAYRNYTALVREIANSLCQRNNNCFATFSLVNEPSPQRNDMFI